jgi:hypothetical protein
MADTMLTLFSVLFTVSCALLPTLWYKNNMKKPAKTVEEA